MTYATVTFQYKLADGRDVVVEATFDPPDRSVGIDYPTVDDLKIQDDADNRVEVSDEEYERISTKADLVLASEPREPIPGDYD